MKNYCVFILLCFCITFSSFGQSKSDNFTSDDRKVLTDLQGKVGQLEVKLDVYQKQTQRLFDNLQTFLYWGFGILISLMGFLLGFVLWDRRTTLAPVMKEAEELKKQENKILDVLREYSEKVPELRQLLKKAGIL